MKFAGCLALRVEPKKSDFRAFRRARSHDSVDHKQALGLVIKGSKDSAGPPQQPTRTKDRPPRFPLASSDSQADNRKSGQKPLPIVFKGTAGVALSKFF